MRTDNNSPTGMENASGTRGKHGRQTARDNQREGTPPGPKAARRSVKPASGKHPTGRSEDRRESDASED